MTYRFVWADGALRLGGGYSSIHHREILNQMKADGQVDQKPQNVVGGNFSEDNFHGPAFDNVTIIYSIGEDVPTKDELKRMIQADIGRFGREASYRAKADAMVLEAATSEDTEPVGKEVGFLNDPHNELYPYLFPNGGTEMPDKVRHLIKAHVLNQLDEAFEDADTFIYFTVYGSGISYNWDEGGDLDVQMWVDIEKFQALNDDKATWTMDDLLAEVRRNVQLVNFPTIKDIGLVAPQDAKDVDGSMLVQYYPKPGKGTEEENLASKPYACLDLEDGHWIVKATKMPPTFYGLHFIEIMPKAKDMALQAEALLDEFERNVLNWQFWFSLYSRYRNPAYQAQYQEAQRNAIIEHQGIKTMFEGIFGGRAEAYSPEGKGIEDERDMLQKLLEVWGIFQRLKHYSRAALPWGEQELPPPPQGVGKDSADSYPDEQDGNATDDSEDFSVRHDPMVPAYVRWRNTQRERISKEADLAGLPATVNVPGHGRLQVGAHPELQQIAQDYAQQNGIDYNPPQDYTKVDPQNAKNIADEYERMQHNPNDPQVKASYDALIRETMAQYQALVNAGYQFEFYPQDHDPYPNSPREAVMDLHNNKHMYVFSTSEGFGQEDEDSNDHPLLRDSGIRWQGKPVTYNDIFRAVHDVFGHAKEGVGFRADGEENAWRQHSAMYSDLAKPALTSETRGQNSWVNYGPYGEHNQNANQSDTVYADQKAGLLPEWTTHDTPRTSSAHWKIASSLLDTIKAQGGGTFTSDGSPVDFSTGFFVSIHGKELTIPLEDAKDEMVSDYARDWLNPDELLGAWVSDGMLYLDSTKHIEDRDEAMKFGELERQKAIWDIANGMEIFLGGDEMSPAFARFKFASQLTFEVEESPDDNGNPAILCRAFMGEQYVGYLRARTTDGLIADVRVLPEYQRQGIATAMLHHLRKLGYRVDHNWGGMTDEGAEWAQRSSGWKLGGSQDSPEHRDPGGWAGIMEKAQRLRDEGGVQVMRNGVQNIVGQVQGDHGSYQTEIWRQDPGRNTISLWNCECPWGGFSWGRTRQWKKFEGRPCAHALALYWQAQTQPLDEEYGQDQQLTIPGIDPYGGQPQQPQSPIDLNQALQQTVQPTPTMPTPTMPQGVMPQAQPIQEPQKPKEPEQMTITFPGALSKWRKNSALINGDYARINKAMIGFDDRGTQYTVPRNSIVEIIWSDDEETIAIYSLGSGPLGPHNARIVGETANFSWVPRTKGTAPRRQR